MNDDHRQNQSEENLPDDEEPILLTEEVSSDEQDEEVISDLEALRGDDVIANGGTVEDDLAIALGYSLTPEKIDRALERVIEKLYGQRIEGLLVKAVQNRVSAEVEKIKKSFKGD